MKDYHSHHFILYEDPEWIGYTTIFPLPFLHGRKWDQTALNYVHALRPSGIRVSNGPVTCDAFNWRVTVIVDDNDMIIKIYQEVEVGCTGYEDAYEMDCEINRPNE